MFSFDVCLACKMQGSVDNFAAKPCGLCCGVFNKGLGPVHTYVTIALTLKRLSRQKSDPIWTPFCAMQPF